MQETVFDQLCNTMDSMEKERDALGRGPGARELSLAVTKLEEALMWAQRGLRMAEPAENGSNG